MEAPSFEERLEMLKENQLRRQQMMEVYKEFIDSMIIRRGRGIRYRTFLHSALHHGAKTCFTSEDDEYEFIGKFGRGMWDENGIRRSFNKEQQATLIELARGYGAFDY